MMEHTAGEYETYALKELDCAEDADSAEDRRLNLEYAQIYATLAQAAATLEAAGIIRQALDRLPAA